MHPSRYDPAHARPVPVIVAQAAAEYGALSAMAAGLEAALFKFQAWMGSGYNAYLVGGAVCLLAVLLLKRRR
jgi:hypothetical protein